MVAPLSLFASCAPGLEALLARELTGLGALDVVPDRGGVHLRGHRALIARVNLESGLATHLLVRVGRFVARRFEALEEEVAGLPLERFLHPGVPRTFRVSARKSRLIHTGAVAERVARSIAGRLGDTLVDPDGDEGVPVLVRLVHDRVEVSIDTSGEPLHRRGYRLRPGAAPLREDLARALIVASGWDPSTPLVDPFAGVGTIPIEAAILARGLAPGRLRSFAFERTPLHEEATWARVRAQADGRARDDAPPVRGSDRVEGAIEDARANAERAGVAVELEVAAVSEARIAGDAAAGALVTDPPHGRRLAGADLTPLYRALGRRVAELPPGWRVALYSARRALGQRVAPELSTAFVTDAGSLKLRALVRGSEALLRANDQADALDPAALDEG